MTKENKKEQITITIKRIVYIVLMLSLMFGTFGSINWMAAWAFIGISLLAKLLFGTYLGRKDPELVKRRQQIQAGTKQWDKIWLTFYALTYFAILAVAGLDAGRFHWTDVPLWGMAVGAAGYIISMVFTFWAMVTNTHFEGTVRIQADREHKVIDTGPYGYIRHPGYISLIIMMLSLPLLLGSLSALIPAATIALLFVIRTALEDKTLQAELVGYQQYTQAVRYRLVPGVW